MSPVNNPAVSSAGEAFPVGSVFIAVVSTNPATLLGYGTWSAFGAGRVLVSLDAGQVEFDTVLETGGAKTHTLTEAEIPSHTHVQDAHNHLQDAHNHTQDSHTHVENAPDSAAGGAVRFASDNNANGSIDSTLITGGTVATNQPATATNQPATAANQNTGGGGAHNNLQPYIVVFMWERTA